MKTDKKVSVTYRGVTYDDAQNSELTVDDPAVVARQEATVSSASQLVSVTLPMSMWRILLPAIIEQYHRGAHGVGHLKEQLGAVEDSITDEDRARVELVLEHDSNMAGLVRWALETTTVQIGKQMSEADPFFAVDFPELVAHSVDHVYDMAPHFSDEEAAALLSPAAIQRDVDRQVAEIHAEEAKAQSEVTRELAKFTSDTNTSGKTLN